MASRFYINKRKCVEAVDFIADLWPGVTQYFVCKAFYFADKEHFTDWGRPVSGDFYVAMPHGPVPSRIYELLKPYSGEEDDWLEYFDACLKTEQQGKLTKIFSRNTSMQGNLSGTDKTCLSKWVNYFLSVPIHNRFDEVWRLSHQERAWKQARERLGAAPEMDLTIWAEEAGINEDQFSDLLEELRFATVSNTKVAGGEGVLP